MRKMSVLQLILSGAMLLAVHCAEWGFEFDHPLDDKGTNYDGHEGKGNDIGNYKTVKIGNQTWMAENLDNAVSGSVCYGKSVSNCEKYGRLYKWRAANMACPSGWHLPSDAEWTQLENYVGGSSVAGKKLKSKTGWENYSVSTVGTDDYGFSALPGGYGYSAGSFGYAGYGGYWWSATQYDASYAWGRGMNSLNENVDRGNYGKAALFSVRCVQDP